MGTEGIEPTTSALEAEIMPFNYSPFKIPNFLELKTYLFKKINPIQSHASLLLNMAFSQIFL